MNDQAYRRVNALLNQHVTELSDGSVSIRFHYWGCMLELTALPFILRSMLCLTRNRHL